MWLQMAPRNKENSGRTSKRKSKDGREQADSGAEDDYRKRRDRNNAVSSYKYSFTLNNYLLIWCGKCRAYMDVIIR